MTWAENVLKSCTTRLARWRAATASVWTVTVSHKTIALVLRQSGREGNLMLSCGPVHIRAPVRWDDAEIVVAPVQLPGGGDGFAVTDARAGVEILCDFIDAREHVALAQNERLPPLRSSADRHAVEKVAARLERWQAHG
jgi:hypothetical protein